MNKLLFFLNIVIITAVATIIAVNAWNSPITSPPNPAGQAMFVNSSGNVGIGTMTPTEKLDVVGRIKSSSGGFVFPDNTVQTSAASAGLSGSGTANYLSKFTAGTTIGNSIIYDNGTNVGIGTASPTQKLDVAGYVMGQLGLCIGGDCRSSWPTSAPIGSLVYNCPTGDSACGVGSCGGGGLKLNSSCIDSIDDGSGCIDVTISCALVGRLVAP